MQALGFRDRSDAVAATTGGTEGSSGKTAQPIPVDIAESSKAANKLEKEPKMAINVSKSLLLYE